MNNLRPLPPPSPTLVLRARRRVARLKDNPTKLTWVIILILFGLASLTYSLLVALNVFDPAEVEGFDSITAHAGYVANAQRELQASVVRFDRVISSGAITATVVLTPEGIVLSSTLSSNENIDIVSNQSQLPHYIEYQGVEYRQLAVVVNTKTSLFDTPDAEIWTSDLGTYRKLVEEYKSLSNPSRILTALLPNLNIENAQLRKDGSTFIYANGLVESLPSFLNNRYEAGNKAKSKYHLYITISKQGLLSRMFLIYPDDSSVLISISPRAVKVVDKPDLTKVIPNLNLKDKTK